MSRPESAATARTVATCAVRWTRNTGIQRDATESSTLHRVLRLVNLSHFRRLLRVTGLDAEDFLQGIVTQDLRILRPKILRDQNAKERERPRVWDVRSKQVVYKAQKPNSQQVSPRFFIPYLQAAASAPFALLNSQGRVLVDGHVIRVPPRQLVETDGPARHEVAALDYINQSARNPTANYNTSKHTLARQEVLQDRRDEQPCFLLDVHENVWERFYKFMQRRRLSSSVKIEMLDHTHLVLQALPSSVEAFSLTPPPLVASEINSSHTWSSPEETHPKNMYADISQQKWQCERVHGEPQPLCNLTRSVDIGAIYRLSNPSNDCEGWQLEMLHNLALTEYPFANGHCTSQQQQSGHERQQPLQEKSAKRGLARYVNSREDFATMTQILTCNSTDSTNASATLSADDHDIGTPGKVSVSNSALKSFPLIISDGRSWRLGYRVYVMDNTGMALPSQSCFPNAPTEMLNAKDYSERKVELSRGTKITSDSSVQLQSAHSHSSVQMSTPAVSSERVQAQVDTPSPFYHWSSILSSPLLSSPLIYTLRRHLLAIAEGPAEVGIQNHLLLPLNFDWLMYVQPRTNKGCFIGQELVTRAMLQLTVRRRLASFVIIPNLSNNVKRAFEKEMPSQAKSKGDSRETGSRNQDTKRLRCSESVCSTGISSAKPAPDNTDNVGGALKDMSRSSSTEEADDQGIVPRSTQIKKSKEAPDENVQTYAYPKFFKKTFDLASWPLCVWPQLLVQWQELLLSEERKLKRASGASDKSEVRRSQPVSAAVDMSECSALDIPCAGCQVDVSLSPAADGTGTASPSTFESSQKLSSRALSIPCNSPEKIKRKLFVYGPPAGAIETTNAIGSREIDGQSAQLLQSSQSNAYTDKLKGTVGDNTANGPAERSQLAYREEWREIGEVLVEPRISQSNFEPRVGLCFIRTRAGQRPLKTISDYMSCLVGLTTSQYAVAIAENIFALPRLSTMSEYGTSSTSGVVQGVPYSDNRTSLESKDQETKEEGCKVASNSTTSDHLVANHSCRNHRKYEVAKSLSATTLPLTNEKRSWDNQTESDMKFRTQSNSADVEWCFVGPALYALDGWSGGK